MWQEEGWCTVVVSTHLNKLFFQRVDDRGECVERGLLGRMRVVELDGFGGRHFVSVG